MSRPHVVTSSELQSLRDLELVTRATVEGLRQGLHRSPFHGYSAEFSQYRHYRPGDDLKYVDWKAFARTDRLYTRQFRETTNLAAMFVVDVSRSMDFPTDQRDRGSGISGCQVRARADDRGHSRHARAGSGRCRRRAGGGGRTHFLPPRSGHHHLRVLLSELSRLAPPARPRSNSALRHAATLMKRRGVVIASLISTKTKPAAHAIAEAAAAWGTT